MQYADYHKKQCGNVFLTLDEFEKEIKYFSPKYNTNPHSIECANTA